jgi:hypothetical protein
LEGCSIHVAGYKLYYSINDEAEELVNLSSDDEYFMFTAPAAALCVIRVAAATRRGSGPMKSVSLKGEFL